MGAVSAYPDCDPRDIIELNYDIYKPSTTYSELSKAIQKDMVLSNLSHNDVLFIKMEFSLIETLVTLLRRHPDRYASLQNTINDELTKIANIVTLSRGENGFTAKLMRKTVHEQRQSMSYEMGREKQRQGTVGKAREFVGM